MQSPLEAIRCETPLTDLLRKARPIGHDSIVTFPNLRQEVYSELAQLDQVTGVKVSLIGTPASLDPGLPRSGKKFWKTKNFPGQGKSGNYIFSQGNLKKKKKKVREKSGNFKIFLKRC